jgi:succinate dehydrogenase / fumarate reductase iron-sulfur subunit
MRINGVCGLACQKLVKDYHGSEIVLEPLPHFRILKDLMVDMDEFLDRIKAMRPYLLASLPAPDKERLQDPVDRKKVEEVIRCILCGSCNGACPAMDENPEYVGPAALVWAYRYLFDSRDERHDERLQAVAHPNAAPSCKNYFECTRVCPKGIPVTKSINLMKREIAKVLDEN